MCDQGILIVIDSLNSLAASESDNLLAILSSFISPTTSLLAVYHTDIATSISSSQSNNYAPTPIILLKYLATTIFTAHSTHHVLARKAARDRSHAEPVFGLQEGIEGVIQGLSANARDGMVLEMEHRRKSGRGVKDWYYLPLPKEPILAGSQAAGKTREIVTLFEDHPQYRSNEGTISGAVEPDSQVESTFELGITDKQRRDREGVVLPYFDAQRGGGDGGRILYDMGSEDDFDEEEDEI